MRVAWIAEDAGGCLGPRLDRPVHPRREAVFASASPWHSLRECGVKSTWCARHLTPAKIVETAVFLAWYSLVPNWWEAR